MNRLLCVVFCLWLVSAEAFSFDGSGGNLAGCALSLVKERLSGTSYDNLEFADQATSRPSLVTQIRVVPIHVFGARWYTFQARDTHQNHFTATIIVQPLSEEADRVTCKMTRRVFDMAVAWNDLPSFWLQDARGETRCTAHINDYDGVVAECR